MKSARYPILPRVRPHRGGFVCYWRDLANKHYPLFLGAGHTIDAAIKNCQYDYLYYCNAQEHASNFAASCSKIPSHCAATSNLPWWRRLFRV